MELGRGGVNGEAATTRHDGAGAGRRGSHRGPTARDGGHGLVLQQGNTGKRGRLEQREKKNGRKERGDEQFLLGGLRQGCARRHWRCTKMGELGLARELGFLPIWTSNKAAGCGVERGRRGGRRPRVEWIEGWTGGVRWRRKHPRKTRKVVREDLDQGEVVGWWIFGSGPIPRKRVAAADWAGGGFDGWDGI